MESDLLTVEEVARTLRVDETTIRRWANNGTLEVIRLPSASGTRQHLRIRQSTLDAILNNPLAGVA